MPLKNRINCGLSKLVTIVDEFCFVCSGGVAAAELGGRDGRRDARTWGIGVDFLASSVGRCNLASARATGAGRHGATTERDARWGSSQGDACGLWKSWAATGCTVAPLARAFQRWNWEGRDLRKSDCRPCVRSWLGSLRLSPAKEPTSRSLAQLKSGHGKPPQKTVGQRQERMQNP